jgi:hypothetical protein
MPLAFSSLSHGQVAFGFFNIDSDMLLLEQSFFFADGFCDAIARIAGAASDDLEEELPGYWIDNRSDIGDLMGAIHGVRFTGFIGETYRRFPFPERAEDFRQRPEGAENRSIFAELIGRFGEPRTVRIVVDGDARGVAIAGIEFAGPEFRRLIDYVWVGGYPRWRDGQKPPYVEQMAVAANGSRHWLFDGLELER